VGIIVVVGVAAYYLTGTPWTKGEGAIGQAEFDADTANVPDSDTLEEGQRPDVSREPLAGRERIG
jgi:hypothetical protein